MKNRKNYSDFWYAFIQRYGILLTLIVLVIIFGTYNPKFLSLQNITNISAQLAPIGILAMGSMFVILAGGLDLTAGIGVSLGAVVLERIWTVTHNITLAVISSFIAVLIIGVINGLLVTKAKYNSIITTLVMMVIVGGTLDIIFQMGSVTLKIDTPLFPFITYTKIFGIPLPFLIMVAFYIIAYILLNHTRFGNYILAIGNNLDGARIAGIKVYNYIFVTYMMSAFSMGLACLIIVARIAYVAPTLGGTPLLLDTLAALIIGGVLIGGGKGSVQAAFFGTVAIALINSIVNIVDIQPAWNGFFKGFVIVVVMMMNRGIEMIEEKRVLA